VRKTNPELEFSAAYALAAIPARYALERNAWSEAATLTVPELPHWSSFPSFEALIEYSHALGRAHTGDLESARKAIDRMRQLRDSSTDQRLDYFKRHLDLQIQAASAWITYSEGKKDDAIGLLRRAADAEDILGKHPVSPGALVPAREQLGDLLLKMDRPKEAEREFEAALKIYPGRFRGLYGAAHAAEQSGEKEKADHYYAKLIEQTAKADGSRSELAELREYRTADSATTQPRSATEPRK
jgi:tetratricopeptide (TPR) repeat protein